MVAKFGIKINSDLPYKYVVAWNNWENAYNFTSPLNKTLCSGGGQRSRDTWQSCADFVYLFSFMKNKPIYINLGDGVCLFNFKNAETS